jgi:hypothetical protein
MPDFCLQIFVEHDILDTDGPLVAKMVQRGVRGRERV